MPSEPEAPVAHSFEYTEEDSGALLSLHMRVNPAMRRARRRGRWTWYRFLCVLWALAFLALAALIWRGSGGPAPGWLFRIVLAATAITCLAAVAAALEALPRVRSMSPRSLGSGMPSRPGRFSAEIAEGWVRLWSEDSDEAIRLAAVDEVVVEGGHIYLMIDLAPRMQIPERGFDSPDECEAFLARLQQEARGGSP